MNIAARVRYAAVSTLYALVLSVAVLGFAWLVWSAVGWLAP